MPLGTGERERAHPRLFFSKKQQYSLMLTPCTPTPALSRSLPTHTHSLSLPLSSPAPLSLSLYRRAWPPALCVRAPSLADVQVFDGKPPSMKGPALFWHCFGPLLTFLTFARISQLPTRLYVRVPHSTRWLFRGFYPGGHGSPVLIGACNPDVMTNFGNFDSSGGELEKRRAGRDKAQADLQAAQQVRGTSMHCTI